MRHGANFKEALSRDLAANAGCARGRIVLTLYRAGVHLPGRLRRVYRPFYFVVVDLVLSVSLPLESRVEPGVRFRHGQGVVVSWKSHIGAGSELHQGVTLGEVNGSAPHLGRDVFVGANAVLLGGISIGDGAKVGAGAVVTKDVPAGATARGQSASVVVQAVSGKPRPREQ